MHEESSTLVSSRSGTQLGIGTFTGWGDKLRNGVAIETGCGRVGMYKSCRCVCIMRS